MQCEYHEGDGQTAISIVLTMCNQIASYGCDECGKTFCRYDLPRHMVQQHASVLRRVTPEGLEHMTSRGRQATVVTNNPTISMIDKKGGS